MIPGDPPYHHLPTLTRAKQWLWPLTRSASNREWRFVQKVRELAATLQCCSREELASRSKQLRQAVAGGASLVSEEIALAGFALVFEATRRCLGITLYDEQVLAGLILTGRSIAELQTGEGKTFVASLPAFLHALMGRGVHVVTANEYLAGRDYELLSPVYQMLDVSVGLNRNGISLPEKQAVYACDVTYGADQEFGFDYLRDQLRLWNQPKNPPGLRFRAMLRGEELPKTLTVQRNLAVAIVDEIDSVLIDSATTPLLLSEYSNDADIEILIYDTARDMVSHFIPGKDYVLDRAFHRITITDSGKQKIFAAEESIPSRGLRRPWAIYIEQALRAREFLEKDIDYVVKDGKVLLVDEYTGRFYPDRQWRDGLHQAVEAKEGISINAENRSMARISRQRYFQLYPHLCGMTGTAQSSEREFWRIYQLQIVAIPLHKPCQRKMLPSRFFANWEAKYTAIVEEIAALHQIGRPILVGTRTIKNSEIVAHKLDARGIPYRLLNGKQDLAEAAIVARSGEVEAVTIATNMAGRGTDIRLDPGVAERGGLHVIGVERHESRRIDRQLAGRAARQGDPGSCRFYVAADDPLVEKYAPGLGRLMKRLADENGETKLDLSREIARVQRRAERQHYWARRSLYLHDSWLRDILSKCDKQY
ncbi:MAG TPA: preprotein translocase subunit SecA [Thermoguttaceae bacterium]